MSVALDQTQLPPGDRILRGFVTWGLLLFAYVTQLFVLPTYRSVLDGGGGSVPGWLTSSMSVLPWLVVLVAVAAAAVILRAPAGERPRRRARMRAVLDSVLLLWVLAIGSFFLYVAIEIPRLTP